MRVGYLVSFYRWQNVNKSHVCEMSGEYNGAPAEYFHASCDVGSISGDSSGWHRHRALNNVIIHALRNHLQYREGTAVND